MKVDQQLIKKLREQRLWSQEQLAITASLGLRTIQRIENTGTASFESIAAIASAFELPSTIFIDKNRHGKDYKHTQIGFAIIVIFPLVFSLQISAVLSSVESLSKTGWIVLIVTNLLLLAIGVLFSSLTIKIEQGLLVWHFSFLFWKKSIKMGEIESCVVVKNTIFHGLGIRMLGNGWLYNVSGLDAVQVNLKSGAIIRLGTDQPTFLCAALNNALEVDKG